MNDDSVFTNVSSSTALEDNTTSPSETESVVTTDNNFDNEESDLVQPKSDCSHLTSVIDDDQTSSTDSELNSGTRASSSTCDKRKKIEYVFKTKDKLTE